ncbi:PAAR domain-containing protein [Gilliamella apicola]|uniref:PAAR domain-containing protein n=1 Tax=Gilliamella apicola TaxID=1196095 RepID=UPI0039876A57
MSKQVAILGDATNYGGRIITASGQGYSDGAQIALLGDLASCPKCNSTGRIIEGADNFIIDGKPVAYDGCIVACKCSPVGGHRILALNSTMYVGVSGGSVQSNSFAGNQKQFNSENNDENNLIRIDARRLLQCADELCEKHLYHDDIKQAFKQDVEAFANDIVEQVDSGAMSYEQGAEKIKKEEKSLKEQALKWLKYGLSIFGGAGLTEAGVALCYTGLGCIIGAPMIAHGLNGIYEGSAGVVNSVMNEIDGGDRSEEVDGPLRELYKSGAEALGFDASVGSIAYDIADLSGSLYSKLKLVPKITEIGTPIKKLWYYGRQDLVRYYTTMKKAALGAEIISDTISLGTIITNVVNTFIYDKENDQPALVVPEPEKVTNVGELADSCQIVIVITFADEEPPHYYLCTRPNGEQYKIE